MGLYGILVVTDAGRQNRLSRRWNNSRRSLMAATSRLLLSEIDPRTKRGSRQRSHPSQVFDEKRKYGPASPAAAAILSLPIPANCYPPAVNYSPLYYMVNGVAFSKSNSASVVVPSRHPPANVLVRIVKRWACACTCLPSLDQ